MDLCLEVMEGVIWLNIYKIPHQHFQTLLQYFQTQLNHLHKSSTAIPSSSTYRHSLIITTKVPMLKNPTYAFSDTTSVYKYMYIKCQYPRLRSGTWRHSFGFTPEVEWLSHTVVVTTEVHLPVSLSIWPDVPSLRRVLSINLGVTTWCVFGCSWRDDVVYKGGIVVMNMSLRRICVSSISERVIYLFWVGQGCYEWGGEVSSELLISGGGVCSILLLLLVSRCLETIDVCIWCTFVLCLL